jgi:hypothetical protein
MASYFVKIGNQISLTPSNAAEITNRLPVGTYSVHQTLTGFHLEISEDMQTPPKIYGESLEQAERIITTFKDRPGSTGVLLSGLKGTGKTLLTKILSAKLRERGVPTILVQSRLAGVGFMKFMQDIDTPTLVVFDEFEKVYPRGGDDSSGANQESLLTMLDGVYSSKKLFVMTCNDEYRISSHMINRPGRIFYRMKFQSLSERFIKEYVEDSLKNKKHRDSVLAAALSIDPISFDSVQAIVEEVNRYDRPANELISILNIRPEFESAQQSYKVVAIFDEDGGFLASQKRGRLKTSSRLKTSPRYDTLRVTLTAPFTISAETASKAEAFSSLEALARQAAESDEFNHCLQAVGVDLRTAAGFEKVMQNTTFNASSESVSDEDNENDYDYDHQGFMVDASCDLVAVRGGGFFALRNQDGQSAILRKQKNHQSPLFSMMERED